jgi:hypothetical protein
MLHELGRLDPSICKARSLVVQSKQAPVDFNPVAMLDLEHVAGVALYGKHHARIRTNCSYLRRARLGAGTQLWSSVAGDWTFDQPADAM